MMTQDRRLLEKEGVRAILVDVKKCGPIPFLFFVIRKDRTFF